MIKNLIGIFTLLFVNVVHADKNLDVLQDGIYYIQDYIRPKKNSNNEYILSYRPESSNEFYFKVKKNEVTSYYYNSDYYWVVGRVEATYDVEKHSITVGKIVETVHKSSDQTVIVIGDDLKGKGIIQDKKEIIPVSEITSSGFTINCDKYVSENKINAFDFPDNYILSPEDAYCNRAYDFDGKLTHIELKVTKVE